MYIYNIYMYISIYIVNIYIYISIFVVNIYIYIYIYSEYINIYVYIVNRNSQDIYYLGAAIKGELVDSAYDSDVLGVNDNEVWGICIALYRTIYLLYYVYVSHYIVQYIYYICCT